MSNFGSGYSSTLRVYLDLDVLLPQRPGWFRTRSICYAMLAKLRCFEIGVVLNDLKCVISVIVIWVKSSVP